MNGIENILENMTSLKNLNFRVDANKMEFNKNPGKLKNIFDKPAIANIERLTLNLSYIKNSFFIKLSDINIVKINYFWNLEGNKRIKILIMQLFVKGPLIDSQK